MDDELIELTTEENIDVIAEEIVENEVSIENPEQSIDATESIETVEVETVEEMEIEIEESVGWVGGSNTLHHNLAGRDEANQHPITAITGLRAELDRIESLQTIYSDKKQQADYYMWRQDARHPLPANPYGLFVSIHKDTDKIQICDGTSDVFGVTVSEAAFVGNQKYAQADGGTKTGRDGSYCLVVHSGLVAVRCETTVVAGNYVMPNSRGEAQKSDGNYGYLVTAMSEIAGVQYAVISLNVSSALSKTTADNVQDLSGRMNTAEYNITSVTNVANSAYALAKDAKENAEVNSEYIEEKITEVLGRMDKIDGEDGIIGNLNQSINNACSDAALAKTIANNAVSAAQQMGDDAYAAANEAIAAIKDIGAGSTSWAKRIDAYSVGEYSQAYGLTWEQAKAALPIGIVHIPTINHTETYVDTYNQEFSIGYYYEWNGEKWVPSLSTAVNFSSVYFVGSEQAPYWVVTDNDVEHDGVAYTLGYLYRWFNGVWLTTGVSVAENTLTRAVSAIQQTANELSMEVTNARGDAASLDVRLTESESTVQALARWTGSEEGKYNIATAKFSSDDEGASVALVAVKDGKDEELGGARVVLNDGENGSYIQLDADKINFLSQEFAIYPSDGNGNLISAEPNFSVNTKGDVNIKGIVTATAGDIGGCQIIDGKLTINNIASVNVETGELTSGIIDAGQIKVVNLNADNIIAGAIQSNYIESADENGNIIVNSGLKIDLDNNSLRSPNFTIDEDGNATFKGKINGGVIQSTSYTEDYGLKIDLDNSTFDSPNFKINESGEITATKGTLSGDLVVSSKIEIDSDGTGDLFSTKTIIGDGNTGIILRHDYDQFAQLTSNQFFIRKDTDKYLSIFCKDYHDAFYIVAQEGAGAYGGAKAHLLGNWYLNGAPMCAVTAGRFSISGTTITDVRDCTVKVEENGQNTDYYKFTITPNEFYNSNIIGGSIMQTYASDRSAQPYIYMDGPFSYPITFSILKEAINEGITRSFSWILIGKKDGAYV